MPEGVDPEKMTQEQMQAHMQEMQNKKADGLIKVFDLCQYLLYRSNDLQALLIKLEPYVRGGKKDFTTLMTVDAEDLADSPGGAGLLLHVAYVYEQEVRAAIILLFLTNYFAPAFLAFFSVCLFVVCPAS